MLLSMTGYGSSTGQCGRFNAVVELKAVNNRYLKVSVRCPDPLSAMEVEFERLVRERIGRGTVSVSVRLILPGQSSRYQLSPDVIAGYWGQLRQCAQSHQIPVPEWSDSLLLLPGVVVDELGTSFDVESVWPELEKLTCGAIASLQEFRVREGASLEKELRSDCLRIRGCLETVVVRVPAVVTTYRDKLLDRVRELLSGTGATVSVNDLIRDVSLMADRTDINEEIKRLNCHLEQFQSVMSDKVSQGRKLDFLMQEMFREINTMGSKSSDVEISHLVVEMKSAAERMREILQNVE